MPEQPTEPDLPDFEADHEQVDLKEAFGLPDRLAPLRLPPESELAAVARTTPALIRAKELAQWVGRGRPTENGELTESDTMAAGQALMIEDTVGLLHLWRLAAAAGFLEFGLDDAAATPDADGWPALAEEDVLDIWYGAVGGALAYAFFDTAEPSLDGIDHEYGLDFRGVTGTLMLTLFLARSVGVEIAQLNELIQEIATQNLPPGPGRKAWEAWTGEHGDAAQTLMARLAELRAVELDGELARLTALGLWIMRLQLIEEGVEIPLLPPADQMTAAELVAAVAGLTEDQVAAEMTAWLRTRSPETAARDLIGVAAAGEPAERIQATSLATSIGTAGEPLWRQALDDPQLRPYAKVALTQLTGSDPDAPPPDLTPTPEDVGWLLADVLTAGAAAFGPEDIAEQLSEAVPPGHEQEAFDVMWRLPHPEAYNVLSMIGAHHPDKEIAKAARKAAFKAASRTR